MLTLLPVWSLRAERGTVLTTSALDKDVIAPSDAVIDEIITHWPWQLSGIPAAVETAERRGPPTPTCLIEAAESAEEELERERENETKASVTFVVAPPQLFCPVIASNAGTGAEKETVLEDAFFPTTIRTALPVLPGSDTIAIARVCDQLPGAT
jgi:hypothetical protein